MAFSTTLIDWGFMGDRRWELRSFTNTAGSTGGDVTFVNLKRVLCAWIQEKSAGTIAAAAAVNETFPLAGNAVTIVTQGTSNGYIIAFGDPVQPWRVTGLAFTYGRLGRRVFTGGIVLEVWTYDSTGGGTGGTINTQLSNVLFVKIQENDSAAMATPAAVNTTLPCGKSFTIVTTANKGGYVWVVGKSA